MTAIFATDGGTATHQTAGANGATAAEKKAANQKTDSDFATLLRGGDDDPKATLKDITSGGMPGYWAWRMKELKAEIAARVMGNMGVTRQGLSRMSEDDRAEVERLIMREVARVVREMTTGQVRKGPGLEDGAAISAAPVDAANQPDAKAGDSSRARIAAAQGSPRVPLGASTLQGMLSEQQSDA
ncbi:hypothetical protein [Nitrospirillum viridazoti]|uniref:Uncharacterized protein n=1 Tax=Nitrospirillum viridazoti CBAmc TaxID=1441467 RepID=A0A248JS83_9PROT|nr:hypothetical protein [Nitrospirillum amazonense]ASG21567.1 hypothetical protein Y958_12665 [Nitrospirillum amazonense CBAmc]TWB42295.1 hypothetical protein FBZ91_103312 [Nitrospirillum amazonense]